jgi:hypothetical protein
MTWDQQQIAQLLGTRTDEVQLFGAEQAKH